MKCAICKGKIEYTFLGKIRGALIGKKAICPVCQKKYKDEVKAHL